MSIRTIKKAYAFENGVAHTNSFHFNGKNRVQSFTNHNDYTIDCIVTMSGGLGVVNNALWQNGASNEEWVAGWQGVNVQCKIGNTLIYACAGGQGNRQVVRRYIGSEKYCCKRFLGRCTGNCWRTTWSGVHNNDVAKAGETKSFIVNLRANQTLSFVFDNQAGGNAQVSVCVMQ